MREAVQLSPDFPEAYFRLALALDGASAPPGEIAGALRKVIELEPQHGRAHYELGRVLERQGQKSAARQEFRRAAELAPSLIEAHRALGRVAFESQDWPTAIAEFGSVLAWNPNDGEARRAMESARSRQK